MTGASTHADIPHLAGRAEALAAHGWTGDDAEWLALVCLHSGAFTRAQFCSHFQSPRSRATRFVHRLITAGVATERPIPGKRPNRRPHLCHIHHRTLYRALGAEHVRHRRVPSDAVLFRRLLSLDYVLDHLALPWLPTEPEKVTAFRALGIDPHILPQRVYRGAVGRSRRYFALKLPIALDAHRATFLYADPGRAADTELCSWAAAHAKLWTALHAGGISVHVAAVARGLTPGTRTTYERRLTDWTQATAADPLTDAERRDLALILAALRAGDDAALEPWGGPLAASRFAAPLQRRATAETDGGAWQIHSYSLDVSTRLTEDAVA